MNISGWIDPPPPEPSWVREYRVQHPEADISAPPIAVNLFAYRVVDGLAERTPVSVMSTSSGEFVFHGLDAGIYLIAREQSVRPPPATSVAARKEPGWEYADARLGDVRGVHMTR